jgi:hypothetical protein
MANEARVFAEGPDSCVVRSFTVADATAIPKGTLLVDNGSRTGIAHTAAVKKAALGFATMSKEANDGRTQVGCQTMGVVEAIADNVVNTGDLIYSGQATANRAAAGRDGWASVYNFNFQFLGRALTNAAAGGTFKLALLLG